MTKCSYRFNTGCIKNIKIRIYEIDVCRSLDFLFQRIEIPCGVWGLVSGGRGINIYEMGCRQESMRTNIEVSTKEILSNGPISAGKLRMRMKLPRVSNGISQVKGPFTGCYFVVRDLNKWQFGISEGDDRILEWAWCPQNLFPIFAQIMGEITTLFQGRYHMDIRFLVLFLCRKQENELVLFAMKNTETLGECPFSFRLRIKCLLGKML